MTYDFVNSVKLCKVGLYLCIFVDFGWLKKIVNTLFHGIFYFFLSIFAVFLEVYAFYVCVTIHYYIYECIYYRDRPR